MFPRPRGRRRPEHRDDQARRVEGRDSSSRSPAGRPTTRDDDRRLRRTSTRTARSPASSSRPSTPRPSPIRTRSSRPSAKAKRYTIEVGRQDVASGSAVTDLKKAFAGRLATDEPFSHVSYLGPNVVASLKESAIVSMIFALAAIILYLWFRFKEVKYGVAGVIALVHDVTVPLGLGILLNWLGHPQRADHADVDRRVPHDHRVLDQRHDRDLRPRPREPRPHQGQLPRGHGHQHQPDARADGPHGRAPCSASCSCCSS